MTMYADTVAKLKSQWQSMLESGKMPLFELQDEEGEFHIFDVDFYQSGNNHWYFTANDGGLWTRRVRVDMYTDEITDYFGRLYNACQKECLK